MSKVDLLCFENTSQPADWVLGDRHNVGASPSDLCQQVNTILAASTCHAFLFWNSAFYQPDPISISAILEKPGDLWHASLNLGVSGLPRCLDYVIPTWMLNRDPDPEIESSSWRVLLRACLVRTEVLRQIGFIYPEFETLEGAALEWGHRCAMSGVITRHVPQLLPQNPQPKKIIIPIEDELRFISLRYKKAWILWSAGRQALRHPLKSKQIVKAMRKIEQAPKHNQAPIYRRKNNIELERSPDVSISVILPTRGRYDYLDKCLQTICQQTIAPIEIICVDQNPTEKRQPEIYSRASSIPIRLIWQDGGGQCRARNAALDAAQGDWLFFADDDSEYPPETIENHFQLIQETGADSSTGLSLPPFEYTIPLEYRHTRLAYNLDTGNALIKRTAVLDAGGFDRNYDFGKGADTDLGMRLYLSGFLIMHNPNTRRIHYKADSGGLREYGAWWETRKIKFSQPRPAVTFTYYTLRYFKRYAWNEAILHNILFGNIPRHATRRLAIWRLLIYLTLEILRLPITAFQTRKSILGAQAMLRDGPRLITSLEP